MGTCSPPYTKSSFTTFTAKVFIVQPSLHPLFTSFSLRSTDYTLPEASDLVSDMGEGKVTNINSKDEWTSVHQKAGDKAVIVDFSATWCGPCRMISPYFEELSTKYSGVTFLKVDVDAVEAVAQECGISAMPTFQVWKNC